MVFKWLWSFDSVQTLHGTARRREHAPDWRLGSWEPQKFRIFSLLEWSSYFTPFFTGEQWITLIYIDNIRTKAGWLRTSSLRLSMSFPILDDSDSAASPPLRAVIGAEGPKGDQGDPGDPGVKGPTGPDSQPVTPSVTGGKSGIIRCFHRSPGVRCQWISNHASLSFRQEGTSRGSRQGRILPHEVGFEMSVINLNRC